MKIAIVGTGYVGLSNAMLLAQNHQVVALDIVQARVDLLNDKISPISDGDIEEFLANRDLSFQATTNKEEAYIGAEYIVIATPTDYDPETNYFDTSSIESVVHDVVKLNPEATVVIKSTVPVGYTEHLKTALHYDNLLFLRSFCAREKRYMTTCIHHELLLENRVNVAKLLQIYLSRGQ